MQDFVKRCVSAPRRDARWYTGPAAGACSAPQKSNGNKREALQ